MTPRIIKTWGYLVSTVSVLLLGIVSWKAASDNVWLMTALIGGLVSSMLGMGLRWRSYQLEEREKGKSATRMEP